MMYAKCTLGQDMFQSHEIDGVFMIVHPINKHGQYQFEAETGIFHKGYKDKSAQKKFQVLSKTDFVKFLFDIGYKKGEVIAAFKMLTHNGSLKGRWK